MIELRRWMESIDNGGYKVEIDNDKDYVYITTKMPNIEVVDTDITVGIPIEVWDVLRGI